ncbi:unnamed protein product [Nippostrongylus brasiliensis]|uniref:Galectin n=1 Tax=Nippostrongylus brasiliensis TaxID=27835 RepID=A0A0N4YA04_NIPBR|nr:unnamed protein product [Nippostrongylus brasiliensis]
MQTFEPYVATRAPAFRRSEARLGVTEPRGFRVQLHGFAASSAITTDLRVPAERHEEAGVRLTRNQVDVCVVVRTAMTARWHGEEDDGPPPTSPPPSPPYSSTRTHLLLSSISERSRELYGFDEKKFYISHVLP